jgi:hypothetical protein
MTKRDIKAPDGATFTKEVKSARTDARKATIIDAPAVAVNARASADSCRFMEELASSGLSTPKQTKMRASFTTSSAPQDISRTRRSECVSMREPKQTTSHASIFEYAETAQALVYRTTSPDNGARVPMPTADITSRRITQVCRSPPIAPREPPAHQKILSLTISEIVSTMPHDVKDMYNILMKRGVTNKIFASVIAYKEKRGNIPHDLLLSLTERDMENIRNCIGSVEAYADLKRQWNILHESD